MELKYSVYQIPQIYRWSVTMKNSNPTTKLHSHRRPERRARAAATISAVVASLLGISGLAQAQTAAPAPQPGTGAITDSSLTWHGITLYGIVDIGLQYDNHGAPISDYFSAGSNGLLQKNSNNSVFGATPSNLSQSRIGLTGKEPLAGDWSGVFRLETFFNPQSGELSDGLKSLVLNNGKALTAQNVGVDSSVAGQPFQQAYAGFSSPTFGAITFGRQNTLLADGISKYDPQGASQAFSLIGFSGTTAGGGDTEDRRLDSSLKYLISYSGIHFGAQYKFNGSNGNTNTAVEVQLGGEYAGLSLDGYFVKVKDAISVGSLSAAQVAELPTLGYSSTNSLSGTISDNTSFSVQALYNFGAPKIYAGYEHIQYADPATPLAAGFDTIGGYVLAFVNNAAYGTLAAPSNKILQVYWAGLKYTLLSDLDLTAAYYGYRQNSYATGKNAGCTTVVAGSCSGTESVVGVSADYRISKRFDVYAGAMWSEVNDGLANGYLNTSAVDPTVGVRFRF
jgi:predicted porin